MKKNAILAIVVLVAVVIAFSFLPVASAKKPPIATVTLGTVSEGLPVGAVVTVKDCGDDPLIPTPVNMVRGSKGSLETTAPVPVFLNFGVDHTRAHPFPLIGGSLTFALPGCHVADHDGFTSFRVRFDDEGKLTFVEFIGLDLIGHDGSFKVDGITHLEGFAFAGDDADGDGIFDSFLRHNHLDKGKKKPVRDVEFAFEGDLTITGTR